MYGGRVQPQGFQLQMESFFGSMLCPTTMDSALYKEQAVRRVNFANSVRQGLRGIQATQASLRHTMTQVIEPVLAVVNVLLKSGDEVRDAVGRMGERSGGGDLRN